MKFRVWVSELYHPPAICLSVRQLSVPVNLCDEIWPRPAGAVDEDGNCLAGLPCCSRIPSSCSNKDELGQCHSWLRWAWERKIWWQEMQKWLGVLAFLSFQGKDMWKGLSLTERPSHILLWWNFHPPNNTTSCMFQHVICVHIFSHHGNSASSPHPTALATQKSAGLFGQRVGGLLIF